MRVSAVLSCLAATVLALQPLAGTLPAGQAQPAPSLTQGSLKPLPAGAWDYAKARHLLFRAGFGAPPEEVEKLHALGLRRAVDYLVDYRNQPDVEVPLPGGVKAVDPAELNKLSPPERQKLIQQIRQNEQQYMREIREWWIRRMLASPRPLEEKLVLFWHGHFATEYRTVRNSQAMLQQNRLFREHAAGYFGKLLHEIILDPAMLRYLDNNTNVKGRPNENLAREIMELFSLGEGQGYSEQDIKEAARALTGYTFDRQSWRFRFVASAHDAGPKTIFGQTGTWNAEQLVDLILQQPATARFIARKLFVYFVHDDPDERTVEQLAKILRDSDYELAPLLKTLFLSQEFYNRSAMGTQIKSPAQLVVGTVRILQIRQADPAAIAQALRAMNQDLFEPPNVKGWEGGQTWINSMTLFARQNFAATLIGRGTEGGIDRPAKPVRPAAQRREGLPPEPVARGLDYVGWLLDKNLDTPAAVVDYLAKALLVVPLTEAQRVELLEFLGPLPPSSQWADRKSTLNRQLSALLVLMMSMPEFQLT